jgi:hypothetical protein
MMTEERLEKLDREMLLRNEAQVQKVYFAERFELVDDGGNCEEFPLIRVPKVTVVEAAPDSLLRGPFPPPCGVFFVPRRAHKRSVEDPPKSEYKGLLGLLGKLDLYRTRESRDAAVRSSIMLTTYAH